MFIKYQKVRNSFLGALAATGAAVAAFFGLKGSDAPEPQPRNTHAQVAVRNLSTNELIPSVAPNRRSNSPTNSQSTTRSNQNRTDSNLGLSNLTESGSSESAWAKTPQTTRSSSPTATEQTKRQTDQARYIAAIKIASGRADPSGKGKDVLGPRSPWKLNLYDDDGDGQYDRGKLDTNRDEVDDEKWNFKNGRWEKQDGKLVWSVDRWAKPDSLASSQTSPMHASQVRYRAAMRIATAKANPTGKGKDVLGEASPWKLNLYDDDQNGTWDRAKLDTNRDDIDDEKWNFKDGRWEKEGGELIWADDQWKKPTDVANSSNLSADVNLARYQAAFGLIAKGSNRNKQGKDVLGSASPWKLNLYDDDQNGTWDRAKLDTNRDEIDDEKWNFKNGRWEKEGGARIWDTNQWVDPSANSKNLSNPSSLDLVRYQAAFRLIAAGSNRSEKGKDVLGSSSPWKLNLYDDDKDGIWDRAKLDTNRDEVDDEKWNFKNGRWEKEGGALIWDKTKWIGS